MLIKITRLGRQLDYNTLHKFMAMNQMINISDRYAFVSNHELCHKISKISTEFPNAGCRKIIIHLKHAGHLIFFNVIVAWAFIWSLSDALLSLFVGDLRQFIADCIMLHLQMQFGISIESNHASIKGALLVLQMFLHYHC